MGEEEEKTLNKQYFFMFRGNNRPTDFFKEAQPPKVFDEGLQ